MFTLRPYQQEAIAKLQTSLMHGKNPVCAVATGGGKSVILAELCNQLEGRILVVTHRKELIEQNESTLLRSGGDSVGAYSAGLGRRELDTRVVFAGVASVYKRMDELQASGPFRYVLWDEGHVGLTGKDGTSMADQVLGACPKAQRVGFSATPYRMPDVPIWGDNTSWFDEVAYEASISDLTAQGYLAPLVGVKTASAPDLSNVRVRGGEFALGDLSQASSEESVVNAACDEILYLAQDRKHILVYCVDRLHAAVVAEALGERGCTPEIVLGNTPAQERADILGRFKAGDVRYLLNVGVLTTGFDAPNIDCIALLRASQSRSLVVQMLGRGSRLHDSKENCLVLDAGQNLSRHAPLDGIPKVMRSPKLAEEEKAESVRRAAQERERKVRHDAMVARGIDPLTGAVEDGVKVTLVVEDVKYLLRPAKKYPDRENLLVSYRCVTEGGMSRTVTQFVLLDYPGRPGLEAQAWFDRRGLVKPAEAKRGLAMAWKSQWPEAIVVERRDGWDRVVMEQFREGIV